MKRIVLTFLTTLILAGNLFAQSDAYGEVDTLYLDEVTVAPGREFSISVNLFSDEELGGITIPLTYPKEMLENPEVDFTGGRIEYLSTKPVTIDTAAGTVLVGAIVFFEDYIQPGDGFLFKINFRLKEGFIPGEQAIIDSTRIPPAYLLLTHANASNIFPAFKPGIVTVAEENRPPAFTPMSDQYVAEGESLFIDINAVDPDGDVITLANPEHPHNSDFTDNGDGTGRFVWAPDYIGPNSSEHSPFELVFWASDGQVSSTVRLDVNVFNVNRGPVIEAPGTVAAEAGDSLGIVVKGLDPDFEEITWTVGGLPGGCSFDYGNPGLISWPTTLADSGLHTITLTASDPFGHSDTAQIEIDLAPVALYSVRVDTVTSFSGRVVDIEIFLKNKNEVGEFDLLVNLDAGVLNALEVTNDGTRTENFEFFDYRLNDGGNWGDVRIMGRADVAGEPTGSPLSEGEGVICRISVQISPNLTYVGSQVPVQFVNRIPGDNELIGGDGNPIESGQVNLINGYILIDAPGTQLLGDVNLNGLAFEISDVVYFSNFFISPNLYPMNDQQVLNSDINQDGVAPSVADLVMMVKIISGEIPSPVRKLLPSDQTVEVSLVRGDDGLYLKTDSRVDLGGVFFRLSGPDINRLEPVNRTGLDLHSGRENELLSCLMFSYDGESIPFGETELVRLSDDPGLDVELDYVDIADESGRVMNIDKKETAALPLSFTLHQNVPNPFNPATEIAFDLSTPARVTLTIYNVLGQEVIRLADGEFPAGSHLLTWNGVDGNGETVSSGVYLYRIVAGVNSASRKMILMK